MADKKKKRRVRRDTTLAQDAKDIAKEVKSLIQQKRNIARDKAEREKKAAAKKRLQRDVATSKRSKKAKSTKQPTVVSVKPGSVLQVLRGEAARKRLEKATEMKKRKK